MYFYPWLASLANRLFDHTRSIDHKGEVTEEEHSSISLEDMPNFVDDALRRAITRAAWSLRVLRESPQDNQLLLKRMFSMDLLPMSIATTNANDRYHHYYCYYCYYCY